MRVLLISHTCQSRTEGQPKAHALASLGDVTLRVLVPDRWRRYGAWRKAQPPQSPKFEFQISKIRLPWFGPAQTYLHHYPSLPKILREFKPDIIDLWEEPWAAVSAHACRLRERMLPNAKIISETEQNINKKLPFPFEHFRNYTLRRADYAVGRNRQAIEVLRAKGYAGPAAVVPNAADAELFHPMDRGQCRQSLEMSGFVIGYAGRLVEEKGLLDLLEAAALCPQDVQVAFVGSGPFKGILQERSNCPDLAGRVRFWDSKPLEELPAWMNAIDVLAIPSRTTPSWKEQFGRVIIEAHACGTPVIGSDSGAIPDVVGRGGLIAGERNPAALADAIQQLYRTPALCRELGEIGRQQVLNLYTWQRVAERMREIYCKVMEGMGVV